MTKLTVDQRLVRATELGILVDVEDEWLLSTFTWALSTKGYVVTTIGDRRNLAIHHFIVGIPWDAEVVVDHIDRNKLNNRRSNLRYASLQQNRLNHKGVDNPMLNIVLTPTGKYCVYIRRGQENWSRVFVLLEDAQRARDVVLQKWKDQNE
jgi:hypothetical protein